MAYTTPLVAMMSASETGSLLTDTALFFWEKKREQLWNGGHSSRIHSINVY